MEENAERRTEEGWRLGDDIELGTILALLRVAAGWTQEALAEASGLKGNSIAAIEQGRMVPGLNSMTMVLGALGYPFAALDQARACIVILRCTQRPGHPTAREGKS